MRWVWILLAAVPLAYAADTTEPASAPADPDVATEVEEEQFREAGCKKSSRRGKVRYCRREGTETTGTRFKPNVCRTLDEVRELQRAAAQ
jgi:hypothetical protein